MQAIQAMGGMPPLPPANAAPPPAPPPPDQPPPPPHENNEPLYGSAPSKPTPVPAPAPTAKQQQNNNSGNHANVNTHPQAGNNPNWSYVKEAAPPTKPPQGGQTSGNSEALKKLAEEERLFDIQFQKWEEEIEKWRRDNVNHPDKQAYKEYEQKFEACRAQLMERRQQMKQKRARLLSNNAPVQPVNTTMATNVTPNIPPDLKNTNTNAFPGKQMPNYVSNNSSQNYSDHGSTQYQQEQYNVPKMTYNRSNNNKSVDPQDRFESYKNSGDNSYQSNTNYSAPPPSTSFLPSSGSNKGIPGLDLVPEGDKSYGTNTNQDVVDITDEQAGIPPHSKAPDYTKISKGINNILGDAKIMNILSMVVGQNSQDPTSMSNMNTPPPSGPYNFNNQNSVPYSHGNRNQNNQNYNNQQYDNRQSNNMHFNRQGQNYPGQQNQELNPSYPPPSSMHDEMPQEQYNYDRNMQYGGNDMGPPYHDNGPPRVGPPPVRPNMPAPRPLMRPLMPEMSGHQVGNDYSRGPPERKPLLESNINPVPKPPVRPQWIDEPMFTPSLIVEYEHKPLRLKGNKTCKVYYMYSFVIFLLRNC